MPVRGGVTNSDEAKQNNESESTQPAQTGNELLIYELRARRIRRRADNPQPF